jgi:hypothetical protein
MDIPTDGYANRINLLFMVGVTLEMHFLSTPIKLNLILSKSLTFP